MAPGSHSIRATLALRHPHASIPTLLAPLRSISNTTLLDGGDDLDDFQSNAWVDAPSYWAPLTGLGITYLRDAPADFDDQPSVFEDSSLQMHVDCDEALSTLSVRTSHTGIPPYDLPAPIILCGSSELEKNPLMAHFTSNFVPSPCDNMELGPDDDSMASDMVGLIPDVNMYDKLRRLDLPHPGVNPLDTIGGAPFHGSAFPCGEPTALMPGDRHDDDILFSADTRVEQSPSPRVIQDIMSILVQPGLESSYLPRSAANSPFVQGASPSRPGAPASTVSTAAEQVNVPDGEFYALPAPGTLEYSNSTDLSPVLNAHLGIELSELISRAERFRSQYPDRDIDRGWLSHFAGKLSDRGELLNDFRCYVIGCDQRNKRRDHILVHVGAHIGQRPFACSVCPLRFLRKNECKRHEASHSGFRPYSCDICGQSFVRQDLVKRHVKRTHGMRDENHAGVTRQSRKKTRLQ